jgi:hypothetical protein
MNFKNIIWEGWDGSGHAKRNTKFEIGHYDTTWNHGQNEEHGAMLILP